MSQPLPAPQLRNAVPPHPLRVHILVGSVYFALTLLALAPLLPTFSTAIPGQDIAAVDGWQNVWHLWWAKQALLSHSDPFFTPLLYYPDGVALHFQPINLSNGLLVLPVTAIWGPVAGYNAAVILALLLTALAGYALALRLTGHYRAAFVAGLLFSFAPAHLTRLWDGQLELFTLQWPAFFILALLVCVEQPGWRTGLLTGALFALTAYTSLYYALYTGVYGVLFLILWLPYGKAWAHWRQLGVALVLAGSCAGLLLVPLLQGALTTPAAYLVPDSAEIAHRSANLLDVLLPSYLHPLWGAAAWRIGAAWHPLTGDWNVALGYTTLFLAAVGVAGTWRTTWRWALLAGALLSLALGPQIQVGPWQLPLPAPYALLNVLPGATLGRRPLLFIALVSLLLAVLAAFGVRWLLARCTPRLRPLLLAVIFVLIAGEHAPPLWPRLAQLEHPAYPSLARGQGAVLDIPPAAFKKVVPQQAQLLHGRPILGGYLARMPQVPLVETVPLFRKLWYMERGDFRLLNPDRDEALAVLRAYAIGSVVVHWDLVRADLRPAVVALLAEVLPDRAPAYQDATLSVYNLPLAPTDRRTFALYGAGWYAEEASPTQRWRWMQAEGVIQLLNAGAQAAPVELQLPLASYRAAQAVTLQLNGQPVGHYTVAAQPRQTTVTLRLLLPPGETRLTLVATSLVAEARPSQRQLSLALIGPSLRSSSVVNGQWAALGP